MISVKNLSYQYPTGRKLSFPDFELQQGNHCLLLGESGSGKTTLLHLLGGLLKVQSGLINIAGTNIATLSEKALDQFRGKNIGFIFQRNHLISALTVKQNLLLSPFLASAKQDEEHALGLLNELGMEDYASSRISELSQGQMQRVAIARAVLNKPGIILADEPTSALDDKNCDRVINLLLKIATENACTLLVATHDQRLKSKVSNQVIITSNPVTV